MNNDCKHTQELYTSFPPFALQIVVLAAGAYFVVTVKLGRLVMVAVVRIIV